MKLGIVGLPNVGKSTLFNAITNAGAECANYPFCTIEPNVGTVAVPDSRLDWLSDLYHPKKTTPAVIEFVDIAGLVKGASRGEGLGNKFLANIRGTEAIVHVVRCFDDENVIHVEGSTDPIRDIGIIDLELIMADLEMVERRIDKARKAAKGDKKFLREAEVFEGLRDWLNDGNSVRSYECDKEDAALIATSDLLSLKPIIYAANLDEDTFSGGSYADNTYYQQVKELGSSRPAIPCWVSSPSSPAARTSAGRGRSPRGRKRPRRQARSTPTSSGALFVPRSSPMTIWSPAAAKRPQGKRASCAPRARSMWCRTGILSCSGLMCENESRGAPWHTPCHG